MRSERTPEVNGHVGRNLMSSWAREREVLGPHSVFRLSRGAPLLHVSQQEVGIATLNLGRCGELASKGEVCPVDAAPWSRVILFKTSPRPEVENVLAMNQGEHI